MRLLNFFLAATCLAASINGYSQSSKSSSCVSFEVEKKDANRVVIKNKTKKSYDKMVWDLGDGRVKEVTKSDAIYFPFKGEYNITLIGDNENEKCQFSQKVVIDTDDDSYSKNFKLVWSDEFDGTSVNRDFWTFETGASGWGNNELQNYTDGENASVKDGILTIQARKTGSMATQKRGEYTSTRMVTKDKQEFQYGRIEARMKMPKGVGTWAAFWMLGADFPETMWPHCGEIDIMEYVGFDPNVQNAAMHNGSSFGNTFNKGKTIVENAEEDFNVYGVIWDKYSIKFYVNSVDNVFYTYQPKEYDSSTWPHNQPYFILFNLAIGGTWGGKKGVDDTIFPANFLVDYVRVYQNPEY
ncbi:MAG: glycoside hydrolase family 16 protein [Bacteroidales bacterium]